MCKEKKEKLRKYFLKNDDKQNKCKMIKISSIKTKRYKKNLFSKLFKKMKIIILPPPQ